MQTKQNNFDSGSKSVLFDPLTISEMLQGSSDGRKITWRYHVGVANNNIQVEKEIRIWIKQGAVWRCIANIIEPLGWTILYSKDGSPKSNYDNFERTNYFNDRLFINKDAIQFNGGFLEIDDPGIKARLESEFDGLTLTEDSVFSELWPNGIRYAYSKDALSWLEKTKFTIEDRNKIENDLIGYVQDPSSFPEPTSEINTMKPLNPVAKSIHLEIDFFSEAQSPKFQPLFYFPQGVPKSQDSEQEKIIYAGEWSDDETHLTYWKIGDDKNYLWTPYQFQGMNRLTISQDANWTDVDERSGERNSYFEAYVGAIGLPSLTGERSAKNKYEFGTGPSKFYIGAGLKHPLAVDGLSEIQLFQGKIKRVFFDPGIPCPECV